MASNEEKEGEKRDDKASAENEESVGDSVSSWFSGWYDTAKKKMSEANEFMKHDLQEFTQAVQTDASRFVAATATTMKEKLHINVEGEEGSTTTRTVTNSLSNFLGNIASKVGPILPDEDENTEESAIMGTSSGTRVLSPSEARIYAIRTDPATFCNEPDNEEEYYMWLPGFNVEDQKTEISSLMLDCTQVRSLYTKLVPSAVSHSDFWARYFFKLHQHEKAEKRRAMLVERAHKTHDDIEWDDEDDWVQPEDIPAKVTEQGKEEPVAAVEAVAESENKKEDKPLTESNSENGQNVQPHGGANAPASNSEDKPNEVPSTEIQKTAVELKDSKEQIAPSSTVVNNVTDLPKADETETTKPKNSEDNVKQTGTDPTKIAQSSGESSDDWEKDFDLDMTEDEIQEALKESDAADINIDDIGEDWDEWE